MSLIILNKWPWDIFGCMEGSYDALALKLVGRK